MCGRYYVAEGFTNEIKKICKNIDTSNIRKGDILPSTDAPVIRSVMSEPILDSSHWGFNSRHGLIINARSEGARTTPMFSKCVETGRCVIPASGFYEWNKNKDKFKFYADDHHLLYMAGLFRFQDTQCQHVILTTDANESMKPVHDRMPLILTESQVSIWLNDPKESDMILRIRPPKLNKYTENEQLEFKF